MCTEILRASSYISASAYLDTITPWVRLVMHGMEQGSLQAECVARAVYSISFKSHNLCA